MEDSLLPVVAHSLEVSNSTPLVCGRNLCQPQPRSTSLQRLSLAFPPRYLHEARHSIIRPLQALRSDLCATRNRFALLQWCLASMITVIHITEMFEGSKYIWCHQPVWPLSEMPDPQDPDPTRYAMLAAVVQSLLLSYNERLDLCHMRGYGEIVAAYQAQTGTRRRLQPQPHERLPDWVERVPPLAERLVLKRPDGRPSTFVTPGLKKWNIMGGAGEFFFV